MHNSVRGHLCKYLFDRAPDLSAVRGDVAEFRRGRVIECEGVCARLVYEER
jgi:hypothetical protein